MRRILGLYVAGAAPYPQFWPGSSDRDREKDFEGRATDSRRRTRNDP